MGITVKTLFDQYKETRDYLKLSANSKRSYDMYMRKAEQEYFLITNRVDKITESMVDDLYEKLIDDKGLNHATMFMRVMRLIWHIGYRKGWVKNNPFKEMGLRKIEPREVEWTSEQYDTYVSACTARNYYDLRTLVSYCYVLGQRPGDIRALNDTHFKNGLTEIKFTQQKTKKKMHLPLTPQLSKYAKATFATRKQLIVLDERELNEQHHEILKETGLPDNLQIRDLRRTALVGVMSNGGTDSEGQSVSGHNDREMLSIYAPMNIIMAKAALIKRFGPRVFEE